MKINEVETLLGVSKANIRFYEKQGLLNPERSANNYRDYSEADVERLRQIIILRKLGMPVQDVGKVLDGELPLQDAVRENIKNLEAEIESLNGALRLSKQLRQEGAQDLDTLRYWKTIHEQESQGERFFDVLADIAGGYWGVMKTPLARFLHLDEEAGVKKMLLRFVGLCFVYGLGNALLYGDDFWTSFFHWILVWLAVGAVMLPLYLLSRKNPEAATVLVSVLAFVCVGFLALVLLLMVALFLNGIFHFWY